jgi:hypothetical protein
MIYLYVGVAHSFDFTQATACFILVFKRERTVLRVPLGTSPPFFDSVCSFTKPPQLLGYIGLCWIRGEHVPNSWLCHYSSLVRVSQQELQMPVISNSR